MIIDIRNDEFFDRMYNESEDVATVLFLAEKGFTFGIGNGRIESYECHGGGEVNE